ncbi:hypothetical protein ACR9LT_01015 [Helicobacter pylori]
MRQKHETATSFNQLKEITQAIQAQKASQQTHAKKARLNPTKKAFSEREKTTIRDKAQANNTSANAFKSDEAAQKGLKHTKENQKGGKQ